MKALLFFPCLHYIFTNLYYNQLVYFDWGGVILITIDEKMGNLKEIVREMGSALVAFSGGVDSTFLLKVCREVLGDKVLAVTANSETYPIREFEEAKRLAVQFNARHEVIETLELEIEGFSKNQPDRCYHCKHELFSKLTEIAKKDGIKYVLDGSNYDDRNDHRPGMRAARQLEVRSPLKEAQMTKEDIRTLSREMGLSTWNKPSFACLSSRFPYGQGITIEKLQKVNEAEEYLRELGFYEIRVRHHGEMARIEVSKSEILKLAQVGEKVSAKFKGLGFIYVTMDLEGYRTGSMNLTLSEDQICTNE